MVNSESIITRAFLDSREDFEKYGPYIMAIKNMDRVQRTMITHIQGFYNKYPNVNKIPEPELKVYLSQATVSNFAENNQEFISSLYKMDTENTDLKMDVIEAACEKHFMAEVVDRAAVVLDNGKAGELSKVQDIIDEYHSVIRRPPQDIVEYKLNLKQLIKEEVLTNGAPFANKTPNDIIRGMREGQLGLIYAYVDTGKTSYGVANLCSVAKWLHDNGSDRPVIYAANEEDVSRVSLRSIQCITNWDNAQIAQYEPNVQSILDKRGYNNIKFFDHVNTMRNVEKLIVKYNPRVMFIDQGTKVSIGGSRKEGVDALEELFNTYRDMAKRYKLTLVSMAQGGEECEGKKYPTLKNIYGSKSAVQGELDWAIAIGTDASDVNYANWRFFNISKNKGGKGTYACRFDTLKCQFTEVKE